MQDTHPASWQADRLLDQCDVRLLRRGGPGGQHRNKVSSAVVLEHRPTGLRGQASERRSQAENRRQALRRLRLQLALRFRLEVRLDAVPSAAWQSRVQGQQFRVNPAHDQFPGLLAEALDRVAAAQYDVVAAAGPLSVSPTQLTRLLSQEPAALALVNRARAELGRPALRPR